MGNTASDSSEDASYDKMGWTRDMMETTATSTATTSTGTTATGTVNSHTTLATPAKRKLDFQDSSNQSKSTEKVMDSHKDDHESSNSSSSSSSNMDRKKRPRHQQTTTTIRIPPSPSNDANEDEAGMEDVPISSSSSSSSESEMIKALRQQIQEINEDKTYLKRKLIESRRQVESLQEELANHKREEEDDSLQVESLQEFNPFDTSSEQEDTASIQVATTTTTTKEQESQSNTCPLQDNKESSNTNRELTDRDDEIQRLKVKSNTVEEANVDVAIQLTGDAASSKKATHRAYAKLHKLRNELTTKVELLEQALGVEKKRNTSLLQEKENLQKRNSELEQASKAMLVQVEEQLRVAVTRHQQVLSRVETSLESVQRERLVQAQQNECLEFQNKRLREECAQRGRLVQALISENKRWKEESAQRKIQTKENERLVSENKRLKQALSSMKKNAEAIWNCCQQEDQAKNNIEGQMTISSAACSNQEPTAKRASAKNKAEAPRADSAKSATQQGNSHQQKTVTARAKYTPTNPPPSSDSKYSHEKVKQRTATDGSVAPVSEPRKTKKGLYARPTGRTRKGMEWDAIRGLWVPEKKIEVTI